MKRLCVFCGSSGGIDPAYRSAADRLGRLLGQQGIGVVYGGARVGLMGAVADAALASGAEVIGVIPRALVSKEVAHAGLTDLRIVSSMHERKAMMADLSDGFLALPGGWGTLEEFFEVLTWAQLGIHEKPCGLLNTSGYFDALLAFMRHSVGQGFVRPENERMMIVDGDAERLLEAMATFRPTHVRKWIDHDER